jgi:hypothetical protein
VNLDKEGVSSAEDSILSAGKRSVINGKMEKNGMGFLKKVKQEIKKRQEMG